MKNITSRDEKVSPRVANRATKGTQGDPQNGVKRWSKTRVGAKMAHGGPRVTPGHHPEDEKSHLAHEKIQHGITPRTIGHVMAVLCARSGPAITITPVLLEENMHISSHFRPFSSSRTDVMAMAGANPES